MKIPATGDVVSSAEVRFKEGLTVLVFPDAGGRRRFFSRLLEMGPDVVVEGNVALLHKYGRFFFIDDRPLSDVWPSECIPGGEQRFHHEVGCGYDLAEMTGIAKDRAWAMTTEEMTPAEKRCCRYASAFATLEVLKMDLPVVIDSPYGLLEHELRRRVSAFMHRRKGQLILLGMEDEFREIEDVDRSMDNVGRQDE